MSELEPLARAILEAGREKDDPTPEERARARAALLATIAAPGGGSGPSGHSAVGHGSAAAAKTAGTLAATVGKLAALGVAVWLGSSLLLHVWPHKTKAPAAATAPSPAPTQALHAVAPKPPVRAGHTAPLPPAVQARPAQQRPQPAVAGNAPRAAHASPAPATAAASAPASVSVPPPSATARFAQVPSAAPAGDTLAAETRELRSAYAAMERGDPARALALLDQQSAEYPHGQLGQERAAARVFALCKLGRTAEAHAAAARFLAQNPGSPLAGRVRKACAAH